MAEVECDHSTSKELHDKLWKVFHEHKKILEEFNVRVLAGPYDCPSGARVIFDLPKDEELLFKDKKPRERFDRLCDLVYKLRETCAEHNKETPANESVTVKVTFLSKPSPG